ncbi:FG-GAP-like repeat-containing protein [Humisphaera borealis]|uniref:VCBS repeat-containing protein n=1 Tax=Humisphaera borealis TaxID=2807512 RepID=A0A7M2X1S4_9BACT|nr:FG-GAP-like repeat-containing protein [Humisphaera borealis]QOV91653.1 VCBS repeat-containing protein [Humisphaera borealis]
MNQPMKNVLFAVAVAFVLSPSTAHAVIEAKLPLTSIYGISKGVVVGTVEKVNPETGDMDVVAKETLTGEGFNGACRIAVQVPEIRPHLAAGQSAVIMLSKRDPKQAILHIGDTWALATYDATKRIPFFIATGVKPDFPHTFPGSTDTLIAILRDLKKDGKTSLLDKVDPAIFAGGIKEIGKLPVANPTAITTGDFDGDGKPDLAVATAAGVSVYSLEGGAIAPSKASSPKDFPPGAATPGGEPALATAVAAFGPAGERARIVARSKSITREPVDDKSKLPIDDFKRLTGDPAKVFFPTVGADGVKAAVMTDIDINGDGRRDVLIAADEGAIVLVNRGYGAFFVIAKVKELLAKDGKYPFPIEAGTKLAAADLDGDKKDELIVVAADGRVWVAK